MKQRRRMFRVTLIASALCVLLGAVVPASAGDFHADVCIGIVDTVEPAEFWVPAGCQTALCCEGCPPSSIDWRIRVSGDPLERVILQFENLTPEAARKLIIKGKARWEGSALHVWNGETFISGFRPAARSVPAVASPRLRFNTETLRRLQETAALKGPGVDRALARVEVAIDQLMGKYVVNEAKLVYSIRSCPNPPSTTDFIDLANNFSGDNAVVLLDARDGSGGCVSDEVFRGTGKIFLGNVPSTGSCNSEAAVFSDDNAMLLISPVESWTDSMPDRLNAFLGPLHEARVTVWIATDEPGTQERAEWEMRVANSLYNNNNAGIKFNADFRELFNDEFAVAVLAKHCAHVSRIKAGDFYVPDRLNVYYVDNGIPDDSMDEWRGQSCPTERNIIFIDRRSEVETLAHEFGHSFSLTHPDESGIVGLDGYNIMWSGGTSRFYFTEGQSFRMNVNVTSMLNVNGTRTGPVRDPPCADSADDYRCPSLLLNVNPK